MLLQVSMALGFAPTLGLPLGYLQGPRPALLPGSRSLAGRVWSAGLQVLALQTVRHWLLVG
jgi:hypothetical protein